MATAPAATTSDVLARPEWLAAHLGDPDLRVVEVDVNSSNFDDWHIDGAVLWDIYRDLKDPGYRPLDPAGVAGVLERSGISPQTTVVFYGYAPAFGLWLLELLGHTDCRLLDCSRQSWRAMGLPWTRTATPPPPARYPLGATRPRLRATRSDVLTAVGGPGTIVVDVRSRSEFDGERFWPSGGMEPGGRPGHVPSAVHLPVDGLLLPDGSLRPADELAAAFSVVDPGPLITYCTIGARAALAWFVLTHLLSRSDVAVYDGSWAEWGRLPHTPIHTNYRPKGAAMPGLIRKSLDHPEEVRPFHDGSGQLELVNLESGAVGRATFQPGWRWSAHVKPIANTESCQAAHSCYFIAGRMKVVMDDGEEMEYGPGDFAVMAPGHDAWIVGDDACVVVDWQGFADYAKPAAP